MEIFWGFNLAAVLLMGPLLIAKGGWPKGIDWLLWLVVTIFWPVGLAALVASLVDRRND